MLIYKKLIPPSSADTCACENLEKMPPKPPSRPAPAMGVKDGIKKDVEAAKEGGYNPNGVGVAWTHKFLNLKPWHPMNFRNREKVYLAEQRQYEDEQRKERGRQEFQAEQEYLKTISMLSAEEQERYKQRQSVSWLYQKPPGFDAAKAHPQTANDNDNNNDAGNGNGNQQGQPSTSAAAAVGGNGSKGNAKESQRKGGNYLAKVVSGVQAVVVQQRQSYELKQQLGAGNGASPPRGGGDPLAENQRFVVGEIDSDEEERAYRLAMMSEEEKRKIKRERKKEKRQRARSERERKKAEELQRLQEAKEFLRTAGIEVPDSSSSESSEDEHGSGEDSDGVREQRRRRRREKKRRKP